VKRLPALLDAAIWSVAAAWFAAETVFRMVRFYVEELRDGAAAACPMCGRSAGACDDGNPCTKEAP